MRSSMRPVLRYRKQEKLSRSLSDVCLEMSGLMAAAGVAKETSILCAG